MSITEPTDQIIIYLDEDGIETEIASKAVTARVFDIDKNGDISGVTTVLVKEPKTQETERPYTDITEAGWEEHKHPRDEGGKFAGGGGAQAIVGSVENKFKQNYDMLKQYDENPDGLGFESIEITDRPTAGQQATTYFVLGKYPDLDEKHMLEQGMKADQLRQQATVVNEATTTQLTDALPFAKVSGRVKSRKSMLTKLGRKRKYDDVSQLKDLSGNRVLTGGLAENAVAAEYVRTNFDIVKEEDKVMTPTEGYRAVHFDVRNADGSMSEIQVRTGNEDKWANFFHDKVFHMEGMGAEQKQLIDDNIMQIQMYAAQMSEYYYQIDLGNSVMPPVCPPNIQTLIGCL